MARSYAHRTFNLASVLKTSIIVPARNDAEALPFAIDSIEAQENVEVVDITIAIGPSIDDTAEVAHQLAERSANVTVVENPTGRTPQALNLAISAGSGEVVVRVDARSVLPKHYIAHALETLERTGAANVGAIQMPAGRTPTERSIAAAMRSRLGSGGAKYRGGAVCEPVDTAYLGVFRRDALAVVGGFDERFTRNQDSELNIRLRAAGFEVWLDPRLVVGYTPRGSYSSLAAQYWQYGWWRAITARTHPQSVRLRHLAAPVVVLVIGLSLALSLVSHPYFLFSVGLYGVALGLSALTAPGELSIKERPGCATAIGVMHLSWGTAFMVSSAVGRLRSLRQGR